MIFTARYLIELPYIVNLSDGDYDFRYEDSIIRMNINNNFYALVRYVNSCQLTAAMGFKEELLQHLTPSLSLIKAKTTVSFISSYEVSKLPSISHQESLDYFRRITPVEDSYLSEDEAENIITGLNEDEKKDLIRSAGMEKMATELFPAKNATQCLDLVNNFIRHYSVYFGDYFSEEVSLYQVASGLTNGIMIQVFCDNKIISAIPLVGLITPIQRGAWHVHDEIKTKEFKKILLDSQFDKQSELLLIRAKNLKTKGAFRSALLEASASIENYVRLLLIREMKESGLSDDDTEEILQRTHQFESRCKTLFKKYFFKSIPEICPLEWQVVKADRDSIRHKTTHTSHEPTEKEVDMMIRHIESLILKVDSYLVDK